MADSTNDGPPQEGLDPKLKSLADLVPAAAATGGDAVNIESAPSGSAPTTEITETEHPPQVGQDPKLLACVNDHPPQVGQDPKLLACVNDEKDQSTQHMPVPVSASSNVNNGARKAATTPSETMPYHDKCGEAAPASVGDNITAPSSPKKETAVGATIPIHDNASNPERPSEQKPPPTQKAKSNAQKVNAKPNLTSSESLAEWNRIHGNTIPSYNFFKKSQQGNKTKPASSTAKAIHVPAHHYDGNVGVDEKSKARAAVASAIDGAAPAQSGVKPSFASKQGVNTVHVPQSRAAINRPLESEAQNKPSTASTSVPKAPPPPAQPSNTNSNFWLQEEEERFLLGLRLYGWGQWKRIQTIVQTRTNKQIKSHAQKREKVNPEIKFKYGKGKSRRGRISSKILADDARAMAVAGGSVGDVADAILNNDAAIPSLDQAWKDVYGTNNGDGPNSRHRRYRAAHRYTGGKAVSDLTPQQQRQLALLELGTQQAQQHPQSQQLPSPTRNQPTTESLHYYNQHMGANRAAGVSTVEGMRPHAVERGVVNPSSQPHQDTVPGSRYSSSAVHLPEAMLPALPGAIDHTAPASTEVSNVSSPSKHTDTASLRPGMRIYSRTAGNRWCPGTIYSAKIDPNKLSRTQTNPKPHQKESLPLVFHVQYENGSEDPSVPEEYVMSKQFYEQTIHELERRHAIRRPAGFMSHYPHPLDTGRPVYCQWNDMLVPDMHGRWFAGTIHSYRRVVGTDSVPVYLYHVLFDNEGERHDIHQQNVLDRMEYHELSKLNHQNNLHGEETPIEELYKLFHKKEANHGDYIRQSNGHPPHLGHLVEGRHHQQHHGSTNHGDGNGQASGQLDLLFTASEMRTHGAAPLNQEHGLKRRTPAGAEIYDGHYKRQALDHMKQSISEHPV